MPFISTPVRLALNSVSPIALAAGFKLGDQLDQILSNVSAGNLGITAAAADVDAVAAGGGSVSRNPDADAGLTMGYTAGRVWVDGGAFVAVAAGAIALSPSTTNYVEVDATGAVSKNNVGFSQDKCPLFTAVTTSTEISSVTQAKAINRCRPPGGYPGAVLSTAAKTIRLQQQLGTIAASSSFLIPSPSHAAKLSRVALVVDTAIAMSASDYWTFTVQNKGIDGSGVNQLLDATAVNTTNTSGSAIAAYTQRALVLQSTVPANLTIAANSCLLFAAAKSGAAANLSRCALEVDFTFDV